MAKQITSSIDSHRLQQSSVTSSATAANSRVMPSTKVIILSLALLVLFASSLIFFLTFASFSETLSQVNRKTSKSMSVSELLNANLGSISEVTCILVAPNQCLPLLEVNLATLFAINYRQQFLTTSESNKNDKNNNSCQMISIIQNLCFSQQDGQFQVVSMFLFKQKVQIKTD